jgi:hypothetical protein
LVEVTVLVADRFPNFSICGQPYHISRGRAGLLLPAPLASD